jgi:23S rRNA-intervening sequence protein
MARYEHLPIYKKAMDLTVYLEKIVRSFSRYHKYTLGSELRAKSREIVGVIIAANSRVEKLAFLLELREKFEGLQVLLRICAFNGSGLYVCRESRGRWPRRNGGQTKKIVYKRGYAFCFIGSSQASTASCSTAR